MSVFFCKITSVYYTFFSLLITSDINAWSLLINFSILLFFMGIIWLLLNWKNFLITLLCIELMYFGIILAFIFVSTAYSDPKGQIYALIFVILAASESAIGLGILIVLYRLGQTIDFKDYHEIHG